MIEPSLPQRLLMACLTLLFAVLALEYAARILGRIWPTLAVDAGALLVVMALVALLRWRRNRW